MTEPRPDPLEALRAAAADGSVSLPESLLEQVLKLETEATEQNIDRAMVQASLRALIEAAAKAMP